MGGFSLMIGSHRAKVLIEWVLGFIELQRMAISMGLLWSAP